MEWFAIVIGVLVIACRARLAAHPNRVRVPPFSVFGRLMDRPTVFVLFGLGAIAIGVWGLID